MRSRPGGVVNWRGETAGEIIGGEPFAPRVRLIGEFGAEPQRERAARRLEAFAAAEATRRLSALKHLKEAIEDGRLKGLARGLAYQLVEQFGVLDRRAADARIRLLSRNERRTLKALGVRFGAFSLYLPSLLEPKAQLLGVAYAELASPGWRPNAASLNPLAASGAAVPRRLPCVACAPWGNSSRRSPNLNGSTRLRAPLGPKGRAPSTSPTRCLRTSAGGATTRITSCARLGFRACGTAKARTARCFAAAPRPTEPTLTGESRRDPVRRACRAHEAGGASAASPQAQARSAAGRAAS